MIKKSRIEVQQEIRDYLQPILKGNTPSEVSVIATLERAAADIVADLYNRSTLDYEQSLVTLATGITLEERGRLLGVTKRRGRGSNSQSGQLFYVKSGTFGDLNNGQSITIRAGTIVTSEDGQYKARVRGIETEPNSPVILPATASRALTYVENVDRNPTSVIPNNVLNQFVTPVAGIYTRNVSAIRAEEDETEENFRYRIMLAAGSLYSDNRTKLELLALSTPGVSNVIIRDLVKGPGSVEILLVGTQGVPTLQTVLNLTSRLRAQFPGLYFEIIPVATRLISLFVSSEESVSESLLNTELVSYVDTLNPGDPFLFSQYSRNVQSITGVTLQFVKAQVEGDDVMSTIVPQFEDTVFVVETRGGLGVNLV